jgi:hypothetical protein
LTRPIFLLARDVARQRHHGRRTEQADIDAGGGEARGLGGDRQIAARHELAAGRGRDALHGGDDGLRQTHDRLHHRAAGVHDLPKIGPAAIRVAAARGQFLHVVARRERRTIGRDDDGADAVVVMDFSQRAVQLGDQALRQAVARRRPVEGEQADAADILLQQDRRERCGRASSVGGHSEVSTPGFLLGFDDNLM